jgi:small conductance mechanosensitive channel
MKNRTYCWIPLALLIVVAFLAGPAAARDTNEPNLAAFQEMLKNPDMNTAGQVWVTIKAILTRYGLQVLGALAIYAIGKWLARVVSRLVMRALTKARVDPTLVPFIENLIYAALMGFVIIAALAQFGVQTASIIAVLGAAGLAVGLALQGSLANFASGVLLLIFKPFKVGDFVEAAGIKGTVKAIHIFNTILTAPDNVKIIVPNAQVTGGNISNYTANGTRRVDLVIGVSYEDDLKKAQQVIERVLAADTRVLSDPAPVVAVSALADSSVNFVVRPWVKVDDYWSVYFDLTARIKISLDENGITIPFPQRDIHIRTGTVAPAGN